MTRGAAEIAAPPDRTPPLGRLERRRFQVLVLCAVAVAVLLFLHYTAALHRLGVHDALRRLFYLPVIVAAIAAGSRGGLSIAGFAVLGFLPHLRQLARTDDRVLDSVFELVLLLVVGALVGAYADASRRARAQAAESGRLAALGETGLALMAQTEGPLAAIEGQADVLLGRTVTVRVAGVDEGDPPIERGVDDPRAVRGVRDAFGIPEADRPEADDRHLEVR